MLEDDGNKGDDNYGWGREMAGLEGSTAGTALLQNGIHNERATDLLTDQSITFPCLYAR